MEVNSLMLSCLDSRYYAAGVFQKLSDVFALLCKLYLIVSIPNINYNTHLNIRHILGAVSCFESMLC